LENTLRDELPPWELFLDSFMELSYKNSEKSRRLLKYILSKIDQYYRDTDEEIIDFSNVNIEHILPRNPKSWGLTKSQIKTYVNKLGNLTLLSTKINSKLQNKPISEKIEILKESNLPITKELVRTLEYNNLKWTEHEIMERQKQMARLAYEKIWKF
ncbi:MAG: HNH endonuclease, partial [Gammaproteobacteria bacterium]|nr:HNH endonuclease [Gammaproteobacteria bacterium]